MLVAATERGICAISLGEDPARLVANLEGRFPHATLPELDPDLGERVDDVVSIIEDPARAASIALPLDIRGTDFQRRVWDAIREIGPGDTESYADVAARIGMPLAARAVGGACRASTHAIVIPCHRVIASDGSLGGYGSDLHLKRRLLEREQR